jgi:hypothetical protein
LAGTAQSSFGAVAKTMRSGAVLETAIMPQILWQEPASE